MPCDDSVVITVKSGSGVDFSQVWSSGIHLRAISQAIPHPSISKISLKITYGKISFKFPRGQWVNKYIWNCWLRSFPVILSTGHWVWLLTWRGDLFVLLVNQPAMWLQLNWYQAAASHLLPRHPLASKPLSRHPECIKMQICPHDNSSPVQGRITKFGAEVQNTLLFRGVIDLDLHYYLDCFMVSIVSRSPSSACPYIPRPLHGPDCFTVSTLCTDPGNCVYFST